MNNIYTLEEIMEEYDNKKITEDNKELIYQQKLYEEKQYQGENYGF